MVSRNIRAARTVGFGSDNFYLGDKDPTLVIIPGNCPHQITNYNDDPVMLYYYFPGSFSLIFIDTYFLYLFKSDLLKRTSLTSNNF